MFSIDTNASLLLSIELMMFQGRFKVVRNVQDYKNMWGIHDRANKEYILNRFIEDGDLSNASQLTHLAKILNHEDEEYIMLIFEFCNHKVLPF